MKLIFSEGNIKLGSIPNLNLPPGTTCAEGVPCYNDGCYAVQSWKQYPGVRRAWQNNLDLYNEDPINFYDQLCQYLYEKKPEYFRLHSAGDFPDMAYWLLFRDVCKNYPNTKFLVFTKRYHDWEFNDVPKNLSLVFSIWPGWKLPDTKNFPWAWLEEDIRRPMNGYWFRCHGECQSCGNVCWNKLDADVDVVFNKH